MRIARRKGVQIRQRREEEGRRSHEKDLLKSSKGVKTQGKRELFQRKRP